MNEILITMPDEESLIAFCKWFEKEGFSQFLKTAPVSVGASCLSTAEYPTEVGTDFYIDISSQAQFEIE